jgi:hypothetical protein
MISPPGGDLRARHSGLGAALSTAIYKALTTKKPSMSSTPKIAWHGVIFGGMKNKNQNTCRHMHQNGAY